MKLKLFFPILGFLQNNMKVQAQLSLNLHKDKIMDLTLITIVQANKDTHQSSSV
jgi:hypothetical protein